MYRQLLLASSLLLGATFSTTANQTALVKIPTEIKPFIEPGTIPLAIKSADLNGDTLSDYLLILEKQKKSASDPEIEEGQRPLLILTRQKDGKLKAQKRNEKIVLSKTSGGTFGDPLENIEVGTKTFTIRHYGGSAWRWTTKVRFNYSRIDSTWQLVRVEHSEYHVGAPDKIKTTIETPPKHFRKIDISDFDPDNYKGKGGK